MDHHFHTQVLQLFSVTLDLDAIVAHQLLFPGLALLTEDSLAILPLFFYWLLVYIIIHKPKQNN